MGRNQLERIGKHIARKLDLADPDTFGSRAFCTPEGKGPRSRTKTRSGFRAARDGFISQVYLI